MDCRILQPSVLALRICSTASPGYPSDTAATCPNSIHLKHLMTSFFSRAAALAQPILTLPGFSTFAVAMALGATTGVALDPLGTARRAFTLT